MAIDNFHRLIVNGSRRPLDDLLSRPGPTVVPPYRRADVERTAAVFDRCAL
jgi:hypothetical protein